LTERLNGCISVLNGVKKIRTLNLKMDCGPSSLLQELLPHCKISAFYLCKTGITKQVNSMKIVQPRKLYLPAMIIVVIVFALLVFIGFSTYWNLHHARSNALKFVHQRGVATIQIIETSIQSLWRTCASKEASIDRLIRHVGENEYVTYAYIIDKKHKVIHRSSSFKDIPQKSWLMEMPEDEQIFSRIKTSKDGTNVYELAERMNLPSTFRPGDNKSMRRYEDAIIVIGLNMSTYEMARHEDFHHAIVMLSILAILGGGAVFFIFVINLYHRMNKSLRETQEYTRQVVDSMANGLLSIDEEGKILSYNNLSLEILGLSQSEIEHLDLKEVIDFEASGISQTINQCVTIMDREISIVQPGGEKLPLAISVTPITTAEGKCQGAVIILRDLREIKLLEEKVRRTEKLAALGKLSAAVAHEIRNPLSSIRGFAKFLSHALDDRPKDKEYADVMVKEVDRINRVVTDLLNFARPLELEPDHVKPIELVEHTLRLVEGDARSRNITINLDTEKSPESVYLDSYQITHVLLNLVLNALQALTTGQTMSVGVTQDPDLKNVSFWVEDEGPGIDPADIEKIFDPFFTRREKGTGLGLAIVQKIVENHHGKVQVVSPLPGKENGCRFIISIPMDLEDRL
jgi:two-component system sensor histidine kinase HydH